MEFSFLATFAVVLGLLQRTWTLPLGCSYNGTSFGEGETVRTEEPCLLCACHGGALECGLRVCADPPDVLPQGCFFLHRPGHCCPQLFCEEGSFHPADVELRTGLKLGNKIKGNDCIINGTIYAEGSAVTGSEPCEYCYCVEGQIKCLKPRCLRSFEGCEPLPEKASCCPTHYDCRNADSDLLRKQIENFVSARDSSRTLSDLESETEESTDDSTEEGETTTETATTETTTVESEKETTTVLPEVILTSVGFQGMKTEYSNRESTTMDFTEETTLAKEPTTEIPFEEETHSRKSNSSEAPESSPTSVDGSRNVSAQEADDYDAYDYGVPQLPPSLPNLVIFPFVAADAVIKDEAAEALDKIEIERVDSHPVFYKDYFSPPEKTEGGFVPKEPSESIEPFYEQGYFRNEQTEPTVLSPDKAWTKLTLTGGSGNSIKNAISVPFGEEVKTPPEFSIKSQFTKKPVTVTYKNVVVDFYPNYLITTTRTQPYATEAFVQPSRNSIIPSNVPGALESTNSSSPPKKTRETPTEATTPPVVRTTEVTSFFDVFLKSFLSDEEISTTMAVATTTKPKYSSKIKGQGTATTPKAETTEKMKPQHQEGPSTTEFLLTEEKKVTVTSDTEKSKNEAVTKTVHFETTTAAMSQSKTKDTSSAKSDPGALLKLAGCNIYGMMYRVGKVITELSGPCLECLCTDLGVQCKTLKC